jgi:hypothetical protein
MSSLAHVWLISSVWVLEIGCAWADLGMKLRGLKAPPGMVTPCFPTGSSVGQISVKREHAPSAHVGEAEWHAAVEEGQVLEVDSSDDGAAPAAAAALPVAAARPSAAQVKPRQLGPPAKIVPTAAEQPKNKRLRSNTPPASRRILDGSPIKRQEKSGSALLGSV